MKVKLTHFASLLVALTRYQSIIGADDAWQIDYDSVEDHEAKPTKSAIRLKDLLETITGEISIFHLCWMKDLIYSFTNFFTGYRSI